jgi:hypothetical protein
MKKFLKETFVREVKEFVEENGLLPTIAIVIFVFGFILYSILK